MEPLSVVEDYEYPEEIDRDVFLREYWDYKDGEHVTILGPTQRGKTTLGFQLLGASVNEKRKALVLASKPRDETVEMWRKKLHFQLISSWPPPTNLRFWKKYHGYILRPHQNMQDFGEDNDVIRRQFKKSMMEAYRTKATWIVVVDEAHEVQNELKLKKEVEHILMRGSAMNCGEWNFAQRSAFNSYHLYNAPEHLFLFNDPDLKNRKRFSEIGGVDPEMVLEVVNSLDQYQALYIKRTGPCYCIVNP